MTNPVDPSIPIHEDGGPVFKKHFLVADFSKAIFHHTFYAMIVKGFEPILLPIAMLISYLTKKPVKWFCVSSRPMSDFIKKNVADSIANSSQAVKPNPLKAPIIGTQPANKRPQGPSNVIEKL